MSTGRYTEVDAALRLGWVVDEQDKDGNSIFHWACQQGRKKMCKLAMRYTARERVSACMYTHARARTHTHAHM